MAFGDLVEDPPPTGSSSGASEVAASFASTPTEGNLMVACHFTGASDSQKPTSGTWNEALALTDGGNSDQGAIYWKIAGAGEGTEVKCFSNASDEQMLTIFEFAAGTEGFPASPVDDTDWDGPSDTTSRTCGTVTTTVDGCLVVAMTTMRAFNSTLSSFDNSFVEESDITSGTNKRSATGVLVVGTANDYSTTGTLANSSVSMGGMVAFKPDSGGPAGLSIPIAMHHYKQLMGAN